MVVQLGGLTGVQKKSSLPRIQEIKMKLIPNVKFREYVRHIILDDIPS